MYPREGFRLSPRQALHLLGVTPDRPTATLSPTTAGFLAVTPIVLFAVVGFEAQNGAAEEMRNHSNQ